LRLGLVAPQVLELHVHLPREPIYHHRLLTEQETDRILAAARRLAEAAGTRRMIQFVSFPLWTDAAIRIRRELGFPIVYDCHDLLSGFAAVSKDILNAESLLLDQADLVCFSSQFLLDENLRERPALAKRSAVVRNAVNPQDYAGIGRSGSRGKPTVGYVGSLDFWFDTEAIRLAASQRPDWDFVLIGRIESPHILELKSLPNVTLEGEVPYSELPSRMAACDVAVIPFLKIPLTLATNPLKLYEYFSLGIPVVATRLPEIEPFQESVYLSDSPQQFAQQLEKAMGETGPDAPARRKAIALENSWDRRCELLNQYFDSILPG
jgi:glycosyltransferase involved in cell wall biosynthesis